MNCPHCNGTGARAAERRMSPLTDHRRDYDDEQPCRYCDGTGQSSTTPPETAEQPAKCGCCTVLIRVGSPVWRWWGQVFCSLRCCTEAKTRNDELYQRETQ